LSTATTRSTDQWPARLCSIGQAVSRYGLALTLAWIGFGKYIKMEARVLIEHSPLMSWVYDVFSANTVARGLGSLEIAAAISRKMWRPSGGTTCVTSVPRSRMA